MEGLFPNKEPAYKPHLRQSGTITSFKAFEESLQELKFCNQKLKEVKQKKAHAIELAVEPFLGEENLLKKQILEMQSNLEVFMNTRDEDTKNRIAQIPDVEIVEIHTYKIKFKKEGKKNAA